ncbi:MAG: hypothetical protein ACOCRO_00535 [Halanaerobiales bacterium]
MDNTDLYEMQDLKHLINKEIENLINENTEFNEKEKTHLLINLYKQLKIINKKHS